ncbi:cytochrome c oxidase subunit 3 [Methylobacterium sp. P31]
MSDPAISAEPLLREPWDGLGLPEDAALSGQRFGATFGIWIFIASEVLFFGALFLFYAAVRAEHAEAFAAAGRETNIVYGTLNTAILLTSGLTAAAASRASEHAALRRMTLWCLVATAVLGLAFLVTKGLEYHEDITEHLVPGAGFKLPEAPAQLFFGFYWLSTGVHGIHLAIGIGLVARLIWIGWREPERLPGNPQVEVTMLYWGFVDMVWLFLYPALYLPGRAG